MVGCVAHLSVAQDESGALTHHVPAKIEHAPVAADEDLLVAVDHRMREVPVGVNHRLPEAEMILEISVGLTRKCPERLEAARRLRGGRQHAALP